MTKALFVNGSPRKNFNTAQILDKAIEGAQAASRPSRNSGNIRF